jgi:hypothetical protein
MCKALGSIPRKEKRDKRREKKERKKREKDRGEKLDIVITPVIPAT